MVLGGDADCEDTERGLRDWSFRMPCAVGSRRCDSNGKGENGRERHCMIFFLEPRRLSQTPGNVANHPINGCSRGNKWGIVMLKESADERTANAWTKGRKDGSHVADLDRCFADRGETCGFCVRKRYSMVSQHHRLVHGICIVDTTAGLVEHATRSKQAFVFDPFHLKTLRLDLDRRRKNGVVNGARAVLIARIYVVPIIIVGRQDIRFSWIGREGIHDTTH